MVSVVHKRYAQALYNLAKENNKVDDIEKDIFGIKGFFSAGSQLASVLSHPQVNEEEKLGILTNVFDGKVNKEVIGLLNIVIKKNRQDILNSIFDEYLRLVKKGKSISTAMVTSAVSLTDDNTKKIHEKLKNTLKREVEMEFKVDESLLGGLKIQVDNMIFDRTLKGRLEELRKAL